MGLCRFPFTIMRNKTASDLQLKTSWIFPLHPRQRSQGTGFSVVSPDDPNHDPIAGGREKATVRSYLAGLAEIRNIGVRIREDHSMFTFTALRR